MGTNIKEWVIISGKGGNGKTIIITAFTSLVGTRMLADCDEEDSGILMTLALKEGPRLATGGIFISQATEKDLSLVLKLLNQYFDH